MFINCPYCKALVATDPATDLPPEQCPRCAASLREAPAVAGVPDEPAPRKDDEPAIDPARLLEPPAEISPPPPDAPVATESPLSSQIHRIVADATAAGASPGIAPISVLLKPKAGIATPVAGAQSLARPEPAKPAPPPQSPAPPPIAPASVDDAVTAVPGPAPVLESAGATAPAAGPRHEPDLDAAPAARPAPAAGAKPLPSFAHRDSVRTRSGFDWKVSTAVVALVLLLLLQLLLADRARLAADARWRPLVSALCRVSGCTLPPWREPAAFAVLARDVRPHPSADGALRVTATFRNDARWPQPWPQLRLTLSDVDGNAVATRDFSAHDYLGAAPSPAELASGQSASIAMDIVEPAARSVAFDFQLH